MSEDKKNKKQKSTNKEQKELEMLKEKSQEYLNGWQRAQADYVNLKNETEKRVNDLKEYVQAGLILDVLPIYDHYKMALDHVPEDLNKEEWVQGFSHIKKDFTEFFKQFEIEEIKTIGEEFNPEFHEAIGQEAMPAGRQESDIPENQIIKEVSTGYKMNNNIIRPAKVIVSGPKAHQPIAEKNNKDNQLKETDDSDRKE